MHVLYHRVVEQDFIEIIREINRAGGAKRRLNGAAGASENKSRIDVSTNRAKRAVLSTENVSTCVEIESFSDSLLS